MSGSLLMPARPWYRVWLLWLLLVAAVGGCGQDEQKSTGGAKTGRDTTRAPVPGGMAVIALPGDPDGLNPLVRRSAESGRVLAEILDTLVEMDEDLGYSPRIASDWELSADSLSLTYHLQPWVWQDGAPLNSRDVASSFRLFKDPVVASPSRGFYQDVDSVAVIDDQTLRYFFKRPLPDPVARTSHAILPEHVTSMLDPARVDSWPLNIQPVASGPFVLESWSHGREIVLRRNRLYPGPAPYLDRVSFRIVTEPAARVLGLETGELDFVSGVSSHDARRLKGRADLRVMATGGRRYYYLLWNCREPRFQDAETRRALSWAIDRERMIQTLLDGYGEPAVGPIAQVVWNFDRNLPADSYDPEGARKLLAKAGWRDQDGDGILEREGQILDFEILTRQGDPIRENGVVILRENLNAVGARVRIRTLELAAGLALLRQGRFDTYFGAMNPNLYGDPSGMVRSGSVDEFNLGAYSNSRVDSLLDLARGQPDPGKALPVWFRLQEILKVDPPAAYLFCPQRLDVAARRIQNVRPHVLSPFNNLSEWWIAPRDRKYRTAPSHGSAP